jgi:hypothetical protein
MKKNDLLAPLFKKLDKVFFGFDDLNEIEKQPDFIDCDNDEEFDVERSSN